MLASQSLFTLIESYNTNSAKALFFIHSSVQNFRKMNLYFSYRKIQNLSVTIIFALLHLLALWNIAEAEVGQMLCAFLRYVLHDNQENCQAKKIAHRKKLPAITMTKNNIKRFCVCVCVYLVKRYQQLPVSWLFLSKQI